MKQTIGTESANIPPLACTTTDDLRRASRTAQSEILHFINHLWVLAGRKKIPFIALVKDRDICPGSSDAVTTRIRQNYWEERRALFCQDLHSERIDGETRIASHRRPTLHIANHPPEASPVGIFFATLQNYIDETLTEEKIQEIVMHCRKDYAAWLLSTSPRTQNPNGGKSGELLVQEMIRDLARTTSEGERGILSVLDEPLVIGKYTLVPQNPDANCLLEREELTVAEYDIVLQEENPRGKHLFFIDATTAWNKNFGKSSKVFEQFSGVFRNRSATKQEDSATLIHINLAREKAPKFAPLFQGNKNIHLICLQMMETVRSICGQCHNRSVDHEFQDFLFSS